MKKKLLNVLLCSVLLLGGCGKTYNETTDVVTGTFANGYFTTIREWGGNNNSKEFKIVYANDTKVKYLVWISGKKASITPLYNADGSLQIYEEDSNSDYEHIDFV